MSTAADRDLLFGLLALQNDFISRDALVGAFAAWVVNKKNPIGAILVDRGDLKPPLRSVLDVLVDAHVAQHGHDPAASLAALSSVDGAATRALGGLADPDLGASLAPVAAYRTEEYADRYATRVSAPPSPLDPTARRFRILRFHAQGGLGRVSVALDKELNREVAYKEIQEHRADEAHSRDRFMLEGEVTGGLEHPGIVPVYSLGKDPGTGRPFYAMRLIRGENLEEAIERFHAPVGGGSVPRPSAGPAAGGPAPRPRRRSPGGAGSYNSVAFRDLLGRFLDVCDAIAYAHDRGVLHRDLKPGNIMLGKHGETLVVDWGLARVAGGSAAVGAEEPPLTPSSGSLATMAGSAVGTPGFMSPEQAEGRLDLLGPATDVYALGATLYPILTGRRAFDDPDPNLRSERTRRGEFPGPRRVRPAVPKALEAVCLKAMALRPGDRYASVKDLAEDLRRWLANEPVLARPEPILERLARWLSRHRAVVLAVSACVAAAILGLAAGLVRAEKQRARADRNALLAGNYLASLNASIELAEVFAGASVDHPAEGTIEGPRAASEETRARFERLTARLINSGRHEEAQRVKEILRAYETKVAAAAVESNGLDPAVLSEAEAAVGLGSSLRGDFSLIGD